MSPSETHLLHALLDLERAAAQPRNQASPSPILPLLEKLDDLTRELPPGTPAQLRHFLERKSYEKAKDLLLARQAQDAS